MNVQEGQDSRIVMRLKKEAEAWCVGKNGFVRLPVLFWFAYLFMKSLTVPRYGITFSWVNLLAPINLAFHEMGHLVFGYFGKFLNILGGTILECLMPFFGMYHFYRQKDFFAMALCLGWFSTVLLDVAGYVSDARKMELPLVSLSWDTTITHDWNYLLGRFGLLPFDTLFGFLIRCVAVFSMGMCLYFGGWLIWRMIIKPTLTSGSEV